MAEVQTAAPRGKKKGGHKKKARIAVRVDMTPMVDLMFVLLTFYMVATAFTMPQAMEINVPPSDTKVEVAESNLMTILVAQNGTIVWKVGTNPPAIVAWNDFKNLIVNQNKANPRLITLIKIDPKAKYQDMINILDALNVNNVTRFSLAPMTSQDQQILAKVGA